MKIQRIQQKLKNDNSRYLGKLTVTYQRRSSFLDIQQMYPSLCYYWIHYKNSWSSNHQRRHQVSRRFELRHQTILFLQKVWTHPVLDKTLFHLWHHLALLQIWPTIWEPGMEMLQWNIRLFHLIWCLWKYMQRQLPKQIDCILPIHPFKSYFWGLQIIIMSWYVSHVTLVMRFEVDFVTNPAQVQDYPSYTFRCRHQYHHFEVSRLVYSSILLLWRILV